MNHHIDQLPAPCAPAVKPGFQRPFPALSPAQRLHLEVNGYVIIKNAISTGLTARLLERIRGIETEYRRTGAFASGGKALFSTSPEYFRIDNLPHVDPCFLEYLTHPYLVGLAEEAIGCEARLEQSDAHIRRPVADLTPRPSWHRGADASMTWGGHTGLVHCHFVKTLTNLTDLGPGDGGTMVLAGSHKLGHLPVAEVVAAAGDDPGLVRSVIAPAGSTLLFYESTIHSAGHIQSGRERVLIIGGYTRPMFQAWTGYDPDPGFLATAPEELRPLLSGSRRFNAEARSRRLSDPVAAI